MKKRRTNLQSKEEKKTLNNHVYHDISQCLYHIVIPLSSDKGSCSEYLHITTF